MSRRVLKCSGCKKQIRDKSDLNELFDETGYEAKFILCNTCYNQLYEYESEQEESTEEESSEREEQSESESESDDEYTDSE